MSEVTESNEHPFPVARTDWFLQIIVNMANESNLEFGLTLQVDGMLVSGTLVGAKKYFDGFASDFASPFSAYPEAAESIRKSFATYGEWVSEPLPDDRPRPLPQFLHMRDAKFFNTSGNPIPGNRGVWWRGRVCEVGGFILGTLAPAEG